KIKRLLLMLIVLAPQVTAREASDVVHVAIKAFELLQSLQPRWVKSDYNAKRTVLSIMLETVHLNAEYLAFSLRKICCRFHSLGHIFRSQNFNILNCNSAARTRGYQRYCVESPRTKRQTTERSRL